GVVRWRGGVVRWHSGVVCRHRGVETVGNLKVGKGACPRHFSNRSGGRPLPDLESPPSSTLRLQVSASAATKARGHGRPRALFQPQTSLVRRAGSSCGSSRQKVGLLTPGDGDTNKFLD